MTQPTKELTEADIIETMNTAQNRIYNAIDLADGVTVSMSRRGKALFLNVTYPVNADIANESVTLDLPYDLDSFERKVMNLGDSVFKADEVRQAKVAFAEAEAQKALEVDNGTQASPVV